MVSVFVVICVVFLDTNTKHNDGTGSHPCTYILHISWISFSFSVRASAVCRCHLQPCSLEAFLSSLLTTMSHSVRFLLEFYIF